jgi:hypothetical protein
MIFINDWIITYGWNKIVEHEPLKEPATNDLSVECFGKESTVKLYSIYIK